MVKYYFEDTSTYAEIAEIIHAYFQTIKNDTSKKKFRNKLIQALVSSDKSTSPRKQSQWTIHVKAVHSQLKKKNPDITFSEAVKYASQTYKA